LGNLPAATFNSYADLKEAFKQNYFNPSELAWQLQGNLWKQEQRSDETVDSYVTRIRKGARKLNMEPTVICDVIINGLRPSIRMHVSLQRSGTGPPQLEELVRYARLTEAVVVPPAEDSTNLLLEVMKVTAASNEQQAEQLKKLTDRVAALTEAQEERQVNAIQYSTQQRSGPPTQR
jgi:Retrotransposon gag protein